MKSVPIIKLLEKEDSKSKLLFPRYNQTKNRTHNKFEVFSKISNRSENESAEKVQGACIKPGNII